MADPLRFPEILVTKKSIPDSTMVEFYGPNLYRNHLLIVRDDTDFYVAYQNDAPEGPDEMIKITSTYTGEFWDKGGIPQSRVWVYQDSGAEIVLKFREL